MTRGPGQKVCAAVQALEVTQNAVQKQVDGLGDVAAQRQATSCRPSMLTPQHTS